MPIATDHHYERDNMKERHIIYALLAALIGAFLTVPTFVLGDVIILSLVFAAVVLTICYVKGLSHD